MRQADNESNRSQEVICLNIGGKCAANYGTYDGL